MSVKSEKRRRDLFNLIFFDQLKILIARNGGALWVLRLPKLYPSYTCLTY